MRGSSLNDILVFLSVVDAQSFVAGGRAVGLSRSAAGKAISRLEDRLGTRLLNRTTRSLSITDEGQVFYHHALKILAALDEAEASVAGPADTPRGVLRLTVPDAFGRHVVLPILGRYLENWPDMQVEVNFTDRLADIVEEGFDLALRIGVTTSDSRLVSRVVARYATVLCAAPGYLADRGEPEDLEDLANHDCLFFGSRSQRQQWNFREPGGVWIRASGRSRLRLDSGEAIRDAAIAGLGIALLPDFLVADALRKGRLTRLLPAVETGEARVLAIYPDKRLLESRVRHFIDQLVDELKT